MSRIFSNIKKSRTKKSREERKNGDEKGKVEKEDTDGPSDDPHKRINIPRSLMSCCIKGNTATSTADHMDVGKLSDHQPRKKPDDLTAIVSLKKETIVAAPPGECLWHKNIMSAKGFQSAFKEIEILLDPDRPLGGNYKTLAGVYGMPQKDILFLGSKPNPTEVLLQQHNPTLYKLRKDLLGNEMNRSDVVDVMKKWIETNCNCENCNSLR